MGGSALVLGGGGVTGIAWELGMIAGLHELGVDLTTADLVVGTSAGSTVGAQILSGRPVEVLYDEQVSGPGREIQPPAGASIGAMARLTVMALRSQFGHGESALRTFGIRAGLIAKRAHTVKLGERLEVIEARLPSREWPDRPLLITAIDADSGELRVFDRGSGVPLVDAVAASCAVPGVWPPVPIGGSLCIDGGVRSPANADLAAGCDRVVVLAPMTRGGFRGTAVSEQLAALGDGVAAVMVSPDKQASTAIGYNPLDPHSRAAAAQAGRAQAARSAERIAAVWGSGRA